MAGLIKTVNLKSEEFQRRLEAAYVPSTAETGKAEEKLIYDAPISSKLDDAPCWHLACRYDMTATPISYCRRIKWPRKRWLV